LSTWGLAKTNPTPAVTGGVDATRTLLAHLGVELLNDCSATVNPAFDSGIFLVMRRVFLFGVAVVSGPEASVISTSDSLPTEES